MFNRPGTFRIDDFHFIQAATQIEDLGTALSILEEHNWDLGVSKLFLVLSAY